MRGTTGRPAGRLRRWGAAAALVATVTAAAGAVALPGVPAGAAMFGSNRTWSGVVSNGRGYLAVRGSLTVPTADTRCGDDGVVSSWVGLGGFGRYPFVQNGFTLTAHGIGAWYEVFDRDGATRTVGVRFAARPGDVISPRLSFTPDHTTLRFTWRNLTRHTAVGVVVADARRYYNGGSAEWIDERAPYEAATDTPLLRHRPIAWSHAIARTATATVSAVDDNSVVLDLRSQGTARTLERVVPTSARSFASRWIDCR